jgi:hypothetical protein
VRQNARSSKFSWEVSVAAILPVEHYVPSLAGPTIRCSFNGVLSAQKPWLVGWT